MSYTKTDMLRTRSLRYSKNTVMKSTPLLSSRSAVILRKSLA